MRPNDDLLGLFRPTSEDPQLDEILRFLEDRGWMTAKQLADALGSKFNDRKIRELANASDGHIISGQKGYKLTRQATADERDHATNWLNSQARAMQTRAIQIGRVHRAGA